jgi:hypothetical protein
MRTGTTNVILWAQLFFRSFVNVTVDPVRA